MLDASCEAGLVGACLSGCDVPLSCHPAVTAPREHAYSYIVNTSTGYGHAAELLDDETNGILQAVS